MCDAGTVGVNFSSVITADALIRGDGGTVRFWGTDSLGFAGTAAARGGAASGNGGLIELSSAASQPFISTAATIDAAAPHGTAGTLLYDPKDITIATGGMTNLVSFQLVDPDPATSNYFGNAITPLSTGNVVVTATGDSFSASSSGAAYLFNGATGALISTLRGSQTNDGVGYGGITALTNGNYVVGSYNWANGTAGAAGAATWGSGASGVSVWSPAPTRWSAARRMTRWAAAASRH